MGDMYHLPKALFCSFALPERRGPCSQQAGKQKVNFIPEHSLQGTNGAWMVTDREGDVPIPNIWAIPRICGHDRLQIA